MKVYQIIRCEPDKSHHWTPSIFESEADAKAKTDWLNSTGLNLWVYVEIEVKPSSGGLKVPG